MEKKKIEIAVTVLLVVIFVFALVNSIKVAARKKKPGTPIAANVSAPTQAGKPAKAIMPVAGQYAEEAEWGRDPFSGRLYLSEKKASALRLVGIIWDKNQPLAMINERILKAGDTIQGKQIIRINPDSVIIDDGSKETELKLQQ
jgi:hypothetical protein